MEISFCRFKQRDVFLKRDTIHMKHDLSMLRLFEAFSENAPQLVLMTPFFIQMKEIQFLTGESKKKSKIEKETFSGSLEFYTILFFLPSP